MKKASEGKKGFTLDETMDRLYSSRRTPNRVVFVLLVLMYIVTTTVVSMTAGGRAGIRIGDQVLPVYTFAGVLSALGNICVIFLAFYFGRTGYITAMVLVLLQLPSVIMGIVVRHNITSLPGVFGSILAIIAVTVVYINNRRMAEYQK